ncbi:hypothetical protein J7I94_33655 [Streptomyces sp. ISL-12]|uniref:hypothetical protein n=1 Tax=Streptomyces sp. ISL-12 TaxID=2819177 RepID=UPI001BE77A3D|nr:hypothetical protein [Streptomyces sp. ISL-12]MBT2415425.1 hypothetical protein [Streptomyces sp. ISL-12]
MFTFFVAGVVAGWGGCWSPKRVRFAELSDEAVSALPDGELSEAGRRAAGPRHTRWMARQAVVGDEDRVRGVPPIRPNYRPRLAESGALISCTTRRHPGGTPSRLAEDVLPGIVKKR